MKLKIQKQMLKLTNPAETLKFTAFIHEALTWVDAWTPTHINQGGCGVFAVLLSDILQKAGLNPSIVALYSDPNNPSKRGMENYIKNNTRPQDAGAEHVMIKLEQVYLDSNGIENDIISKYPFKLVVGYDQMKVSVQEGRHWNEMYDRTCDDFIKIKLEEAFEHWDIYEAGIFKMPRREDVVLTSHTVHMMKKRTIMENPLMLAMMGGIR